MARGKGKGKKTQELTEEQKQEIREAFDLFVRVINLSERSYILSNERVRRANLTDRSLDPLAWVLHTGCLATDTFSGIMFRKRMRQTMPPKIVARSTFDTHFIRTFFLFFCLLLHRTRMAAARSTPRS